MKRILFAVPFAVLMCVSAQAFAASNSFGIGFILGDPSGFTAKFFVSGNDAIDTGIGPSGRDGFYLYADYHRHFRNLFPVPELSVYVGAGAGLHEHDEESKHHEEGELSLEARLPLGIDYVFRQVPIEVFLELAPALEIIPDIDFHLRGGLGARYYF
jgi:hypothetical protein